MGLKFYFLITVAVFILGVPLHASQTAQELERKTLASQTSGQKRINPELNQKLLVAATFNNTEKVEELLSANSIPDVNATDNYGYTALIWAASYGNTKAVQALIDASANLNVKGYRGNTALMILAAKDGHTAVVRVLIGAGANPMLKNEEGQTALMITEKAIQREPQKEGLRTLEKMLQDAENVWKRAAIKQRQQPKKISELKGVGSDIENLISQYTYPKLSPSEITGKM